MTLLAQPSTRQSRKRPIRQFPLDWKNSESGGRLEPRLPTVPIFFKVNNGALEFASIWGPNLAQTNDANPTTAYVAGTDQQFSFLGPGVNIAYAGQVQANLIDVPNTSPPTSPPTGGYAVETNSAHQISAVFPGMVPGTPEFMTTTALGGAAYTLADDQVPATTPVTLVENYEVVYFPTVGDTFASAAVVIMNFGSNLTFTLNGDQTGLIQVGVATAPGLSPPWGTATFGATTINWSMSATTFVATAQTVFPTGLPSTGGANPPTGIAWNAAYASILTVGYGGGPIGTVTNDLAELTTHYDASFV
ncbi:hypothetical protein [Paludisphaera rhizosphaerae]|uniref:hypothetical protein n=1 Tax=Paludisphaera rhizosphaerae TaxID=2711216 RepID=UPI0013EC6747|nr:hypothetical protein [Paludisphaera rhizosphaerae]